MKPHHIDYEVAKHGPYDNSEAAYRKCYALDRVLDKDRYHTVIDSVQQ